MENSSHSILEKDSLRILRDALYTLEAGFSNLPPASAEVADYKAMERVILEVAERLRDNYPYFHPLYAGQMLKPPHPVARLASMLAIWINPNNHALDGGRASSRMEKEAVSEIAAMFGWEKHLGHLTGGGTMANLEALWVANRLSPAGRIVASEQAHYTHSRISAVLKLEYEAIPCDRRARMELEALKRSLDQWRDRHRCSHHRHDSHRLNRSPARTARTPRAVWFPYPRRFGLWRLLRTGR